MLLDRFAVEELVGKKSHVSGLLVEDLVGKSSHVLVLLAEDLMRQKRKSGSHCFFTIEERIDGF